MRFVGAVTQAGGQVNEDAWGMVGNDDDVSAAWVFDGVTGINSRNYLPSETDAAWFVARANLHLHALAAQSHPLNEILRMLVELLIEDWQFASKQLDLPADYDLPASCLTLIKRYKNTWQAVRLGDCNLLARKADGSIDVLAAPTDDSLSDAMTKRAKQLGATGSVEMKSLLAEFQPLLLAQRKTRNMAGGLSILKADMGALQFTEYQQFGNVSQILLCTDGFYRAVDCYALHDNSSLLKEAMNGVERIIHDIRKVEAGDPACQRFIRFKPSDDATAMMLSI